MSVQILNKANTKSPNVILIDENYCLKDSFDIIQTNFKTLIGALNNLGSDNFYAQTVIDRYNKNKIKYQQFLTMVSQFSSNWTDALQTYGKNINIWNNVYTPLEIVYPVIVPVSDWGQYIGTTITENPAISVSKINEMTIWINSKFPPALYDIYKKINMAVYFKGSFGVSLKFDVSYAENCAPASNTSKVCCEICPPRFPSKGCNHSVIGGRPACANMYDWCPGSGGNVEGFYAGPKLDATKTVTTKDKNGKKHTKVQEVYVSRADQVQVAKGIVYESAEKCVEGSCKGWGLGYDKAKWTGGLLNVQGSLAENDSRLIGFKTINFVLDLTTNKWIRQI